MERTEKKSPGRSVVIGILLFAAIAAALTWLRYTSQAPSTVNAHLISERLVLAKFPSNLAGEIRQGSKAIVTFETSPSKRFDGAVESREMEEDETRVVIVLKDVPTEARPDTRCSVTVDTSLSVDAMKAD
jgi:multidrug resistance efflux pump